MSTSRDNLPAVPDEEMSVDAHAKALPDRIFKRGALTIIVALLVGAVVAMAGVAMAQAKFSAVEEKAAARADAGDAVIAKALEQHIKDEGARAAAQARFNERVLDALQGMEDRGARRFDALQNTIVERRVQPESAELARPAPVKDGGR
jgi:hypothetical protein